MIVSRSRRPGLVFAVIALAFFGTLFPRGYMPVGENGRITVTLCSAYGAQRTIEIDLGKKPRPRQHSGSNNCWGVFTSFAVLPAPATILTAPVLRARATVIRPASVRLPARRAFDPNAPPRAPPSATA